MKEKKNPLLEKVVFRSVSEPLAVRLKNTKITPNQISILSFLLTILAAMLFSCGRYGPVAVGAVVLYLSGVCDNLDGDLARIRNKQSWFGAWLDGFLDRLGEVIIVAGILVGIGFSYAVWALFAGVFPLLFYYHALSIRDFQKGNSPPNKRSFLGYDRAKHVSIVIMLALFNMLDWALILLAFGNIYILVLFLNSSRKLKGAIE